jgi:hypothetical protein
VEPIETAVARERPCKRHATAGYRGDRGNATTEELGEEMYSVRSAKSIYIRETPTFSSEKMLHKDHSRKGSVAKTEKTLWS